MKLVAVSISRNEEDVLEAFARHHVALVDELVVVDDRSADRSPEIIESMVVESRPIEHRELSSPVHLLHSDPHRRSQRGEPGRPHSGGELARPSGGS